jgi:hypothetical protein
LKRLVSMLLSAAFLDALDHALLPAVDVEDTTLRV